MVEQPYVYYLLFLDRYTYSGMTKYPQRRIRQHRGEIKGGARYTTIVHPGHWEYALRVTGFPTRTSCARFEFCTKTKTRCRKNKKTGTSLNCRFDKWCKAMGISLKRSDNVKRRVLTILHLLYVEDEFKDKGYQVEWKHAPLAHLEEWFKSRA